MQHVPVLYNHVSLACSVDRMFECLQVGLAVPSVEPYRMFSQKNVIVLAG
jgi:hypothetical protein